MKKSIIFKHYNILIILLTLLAGFGAPSSFKMRLAGGAWCIAALILINFYSSVLTSLITVSSPVPIVNSVEELSNNDNVKLVIQKGFGTSAFIAVRHYSCYFTTWYVIIIFRKGKKTILCWENWTRSFNRPGILFA